MYLKDTRQADNELLKMHKASFNQAAEVSSEQTPGIRMSFQNIIALYICSLCCTNQKLVLATQRPVSLWQTKKLTMVVNEREKDQRQQNVVLDLDF